MPAARAGGAGRPEDGGDPVQGAAAAPGPEDLRSPGSARGGAPGSRVELDGKFFRLSGERFLVKGVTWGTFAPDESGYPFPDAAVAARDFATMASLGVNTVRVYTPPRPDLLDLAAEHGLRVMVGIPWAQHVAFLDDRALERETRREVVARVRELAAHPAAFLFALGNEIPPGVVRWHGRGRVERFLRSLWLEAKEAAPEALFTYANFPPTEYLDLSCYDVCSFNVYLHREPELRAYLARLQNVAGEKPLLLAEAGVDSLREGEEEQARLTAMHLRAAYQQGAAGAIAFAWTDEWWRGGGDVHDWAFGLVDRERRRKPAAAAVARVFAEAPFSAAAKAAWPRVTVVVCAYNAQATLDGCLASLERVDYPDYEVVVVDDGSRDATAEIARRYPRVRLVQTPNRGLSSARNAGLAEASGGVVAYLDADARADRDWLTWLVQPFLGAEAVVGSGGPNLVPPDDPRVARCVARAPGGPTHVLLDDQVAEHVPGCNMAFRKDALLAIGGFDPIYLRAGDDVDVCWRLQARGGTIGFAPAALVWHHHRAGVRAFWRQQVGYGEGEAWLMAHHPEKFLDGRMLWRGRIYSPLPFVRSLSGTRVNAGVWGTAAFPSVYRTDVHPLRFLPHSIGWQALSLALVLAGVAATALGAMGWGVGLLGGGLLGLLTTLARNLGYALRSDVRSLPGSVVVNRGIIAFLHFIQPLARAWGRVQGALFPPETVQPRPRARGQRAPRPSPRDAWRSARLVTGGVVEDRFWSEGWTSAERVLSRIAEGLRGARAGRSVVPDDGWSEDRDLSVLLGHWGWLDLRALVEEHERGRCLLRVGTSLRPTPFGVATALGAGLLATTSIALGMAFGWPLASAGAALLALVLGVFVSARTALAAGQVRRVVEGVGASQEMTRLPVSRGPTPLPVPSLPRAWALKAAAVLALATFGLGSGTFLAQGAARAEIVGGGRRAGPVLSVWLETPGGIAVAPDGDIYVADAYEGVVRRIHGQTLLVTSFAGNQDRGSGFAGDGGPAIAAMLDEPDGVAVAPDGDVIIADSQNHRIRRVDAATGVITTIAGSGAAAFDGDGRPALETALDQPSAVACAANGDIYIADTMNNRVRVIDHATGLIRTVAGDGRVVDEGPVGDGGPATLAQLYMPSDVALGPDGHLYIADMHHNRVRRVDLETGLITTVAGDGSFGNAPDGTPALQASLAGPAGIALVPGPDDALTLFIADSYNGLVRRVGPDGLMRTVARGSDVVFGAPSRVAFAPARGWLYVADALENRVVALAVPQVEGDSEMGAAPVTAGGTP